MNRNSKKFLTASVAGAILAAQAMMQVAAAGGTIDADMSTKSPILRVMVPTQMAVAVNEFEMGDQGSQITSEAFTMKNVSEVPVNVKVTSEATVNAATILVASKAAAESATDASMWLAAVAAVADNSGLEYATGTDKTIKGLEGTEANITTFGTKDTNNKSTAVQNFYLKEATSAVYTGITGTDVDAAKADAGADYYELTVLSPATDDAAGVETLAADKDVYVGAAPVAGTPATLTKVAKGTEASSISWTAGTSKAYAIADAPTAAASLVNSNSYLYITSATAQAGDAAAFRYIGALSEAKSGWSTDDLSAIAIKYDITAISTSAYSEVAGNDGSGLTYGYKAAVEESRMVLNNDVLTIKISADEFKDGTLKIGDTTAALGSSAGKWGTADGYVTFTFSQTWANAMKGKTCVVTVNLKSGDPITASFDVPE